MKFVQIHHAETDQTTTVSEVAVRHFEERGWEAVGEATGPGGDVLFDPSANTVEQVNEYLASASAEERERVLAAEAAGKNRSSIVTA